MESAQIKDHVELPRKVEEDEEYMEPEVILTPQEEPDQKNIKNVTPVENLDGSKPLLDFHEAMGALNMLSLASVTIGDYLVITNNREDVTIAGEPYLALQLWLNVRSGKVISRIWGQTVAASNILNVAQLMEACTNLFSGQPCLGYPFGESEQMLQEFVVSQTPVPRMISTKCKKIISKNKVSNMNSCSECLRLEHSGVQDTSLDCDWDFQEPNVMEQVGAKKRKRRKKHDLEQRVDVADEKMLVNIKKEPAASFPGEKEQENGVSSEFTLHIKCELCEATLMIGGSYANHMRRVHGEEGKISKKCQWCDKVMGVKHLLDHAKRHHSWGRFFCIKCKFRGYFASSLVEHILDEHKDDTEAQCPSCKLRCPLADIENHYKGCVSQKKVIVKKVKEEDNKQSDAPELGPLEVQCPLCESILTSSSYEGHMRRKHGEKINMSKKCVWCDNVVSVYNLDWHARKHHFWGIFVCTECNFKANFAKNLVAHMNEEHKAYDEAQCPSCRDRCSVSDLESHYQECITRKVSQKAEYKKDMKERESCVCETCGKSFKYKQQYKNHLKNHLRDQAAKGEIKVDEQTLYHFCDKCSNKYTTVQALYGHIRQVHDKIPFPCPLCAMIFDTQKKLTHHHNIAHSADKEYECKHCGKRFGYVTRRQEHELTHENAQFQCRFCPKKLKTEKYLRLHEMYHTGEKPFKCNMCENEFVSKQRLLQHKVGTHNIRGPKGRRPGWKRKEKGIDQAL